MTSRKVSQLPSQHHCPLFGSMERPAQGIGLYLDIVGGAANSKCRQQEWNSDIALASQSRRKFLTVLLYYTKVPTLMKTSIVPMVSIV